MPGGKVAYCSCMVAVGRSDSLRGCKLWSSWCVGEEDSKATEYRSVFMVFVVFGKKTEGKGFNFQIGS